jgi:hypothetical protein
MKDEMEDGMPEEVIEAQEMPKCPAKGTFRLKERGFARPVEYDAKLKQLAEEYNEQFPGSGDEIGCR